MCLQYVEMGKIKTVSDELYYVIDRAQSIEELKDFGLVGGTSLAIRFDHRVSIDIDLFSNKKIGTRKMEALRNKLPDYFPNHSPRATLRSPRVGSSHLFLDVNNDKIRVDIIPNIYTLYPMESFNNIQMYSVIDVALLKIDSMFQRGTLKDMYDLNYITDHIISLPELWALYGKKRKILSKRVDLNIFTMTRTWDPLSLPEALADIQQKIDIYSLDNYIITQKGLPDVLTAYNQWVKKVKNLVSKLNQE